MATARGSRQRCNPAHVPAANALRHRHCKGKAPQGLLRGAGEQDVLQRQGAHAWKGSVDRKPGQEADIPVSMVPGPCFELTCTVCLTLQRCSTPRVTKVYAAKLINAAAWQ